MLNTVNREMKLKQDKEIYLFLFETFKRADYWMGETFRVFKEDVLAVDVRHKILEFDEAYYCFDSRNNHETLRLYKHADQVYTEDDLYVILNDYEFRRTQGDIE